MNYDKLLNNLKKFGKADRSSFSYWFNHWKAFNLIAFKYKCWKFRFLFHDIEKPWMKLYLKDYKKVQEWHRYHNSHHLAYIIKHLYSDYKIKADWLAMVIDWECSRYTKLANTRNAREQLEVDIEKVQKLYPNLKYNGILFTDILKDKIENILNSLGL